MHRRRPPSPGKLVVGRGVLVGLITLLVLAIPSPDIAAAAPRPGGPVACDDGLTEISELPRASLIRSFVSLRGGRTLGVGVTRDGRSGSDLRMLTAIHHPSSGWSFASSHAPNGQRASLLEVTLSPSGTVWAVGNRFPGLRRPYPMVLRRSEGAWIESGPVTGLGYGTAVAVDAANTVWVATVERTTSGRVAALYRRRNGAWKRIGLPSVRGAERYAAVAAPSASRTFVVGSAVSASGVHSFVLARHGGAWTRERIEAGVAHVRLTRVEVAPDGSVWATGWAVHPGRTRPLVLRRDRGVWRAVSVVGQTGQAGVLLAVAPRAGSMVGTGGSYVSAAGQYLPAVMSSDGEFEWRVLPRVGWFAAAVVGDPAVDGWMEIVPTDKGGQNVSLLGRLCDSAPIADPGLRANVAADRRAELALARQQARRIATRQRAGRTPFKTERALRRAAGRAGAITGPLALREIGATIGLPAMSESYGIATGDVNGDGRADLVWSGHSKPLAIYLRTDGGFTPYLGEGFALADRHACVVAPLDADARDDISCVTGGMSGMGLTSHELYLDPVGGSTRDRGTEAGLTDPIARGRNLVAFDADGDHDLDLFQAGEERQDGMPNLNRLLLNDGAGRFTWSVRSGLTSSDPLTAAEAADLDLDGRVDLLAHSGRAIIGGEALHLYHNAGGRFTDIATSTGLRTIGDIDLAIADLDGRGRPEIVQLSGQRLRISTWSGGRYVVSHDRALAHGTAVASGDVDGDGDLDLYVARGVDRASGAHPSGGDDLILRNDGTGRRFRAITVPRTREGMPDDVIALDIDDEGRDEFVIVSGRTDLGPVLAIDAVAPVE